MSEYDLTGVHGAEVFRDLPEGVRVHLADGAVGEITGNAGDGAWIMVTIIEDENDADRVGAEEAVFFADVKSAVRPAEEGGR